jgi:lysophospholipase L1-like esterase
VQNDENRTVSERLTNDIWDVVYNAEGASQQAGPSVDTAPDNGGAAIKEPVPSFIAKNNGIRTMTAANVPYDGKARDISCWGDSMMYGCNTTPGFIAIDGKTTNVSYSTTPSVLQELTGIKTYNLGVNGETSKDIATRQGGLLMVTDRDIDIDGTGIAEFKLKSTYDGETVYMGDYSGYNYDSAENICVIDGQQYYVTNNYDDESQILYGTDVHIPAGSLVYTLAAIERSKDILIIEMGSNGGWYSDYDTLIAQYDSMLESTGCKYYIIVGDTDDPELSADLNKDFVGIGTTGWEDALSEAYGAHFLNLRMYMIQNGLSDCGLIPTDDDLDGYTKGEISKQLRSDWTHFNAYGYYSKALAIYKKGEELGYWK